MATQNMNGYVVVGALFGDEGKGLVTDFICSRVEKPLVIRYSGGQQAGHTVVLDGKSHVFSNFGSGTLRGAPTYWAPTATFDPVGMMKELKILLAMGLFPKLFIDERCPMTTPYDKMHNRALNLKNGHGTCGVGVGATIERQEKLHSLTAGDLGSQFVFETKLEAVRKYYDSIYENKMKVRNKGVVTTLVTTNPNIEPVSLDDFYGALAEMLSSPHVTIVPRIPHGSAYDSRVFESSQGLMLDPGIGFFPHVTRIPVGVPHVLDMHPDPTAFVVTRAYTTRHGNGPMPNDGLPHNIKDNPAETNVNNRWQGEFRRGLLDVDVLKYAIGRDGFLRNTSKRVLVVTCLDHVQGDLRFTYGGQIVQNSDEEEFVGKLANILDFRVVYVSHGPTAKDVDSFKTSGTWNFDTHHD